MSHLLLNYYYSSHTVLYGDPEVHGVILHIKFLVLWGEYGRAERA